EEVRRRRVSMAVTREIVVNALAERLLTHERLEHADDGAALLVGDAVERVGDVVLRLDGLADAPGADEGGGAHDAVSRLNAADRTVPLRVQRVDDLGRDPRRERLVQPDVVPPRRGDVVAEPDVTELVGGNVEVAALEADALVLGLAEDRPRPERDEARVLHR